MGPISAPTVSSARWMPNDSPIRSSGLDNEMRASRGAVRTPLPVRSRNRMPAVGPAVVLASSPSLQAADRA